MNFDIKNDRERLKAKNKFDGNLRYGAAKFHSQTNRSGKGKPSDGGVIREHAKLLKKNEFDQYSRIEEFWEEVEGCPVCGETNPLFFLKRYGLEIWRCNNCSHRFLNPRVKFDKACELYADDKTASDIYLQPLQKDIDRDKYLYGLNIIKQLSPPSQNLIMDLGCGAGVFVEEASKFGWHSCIGVDSNERYSNHYQNIQGVQYLQSTFESLDYENLGSNYDCITMWNVLEHIYDLKMIIFSIKKLLRKDGLFFVMVPNIESLASRLIREKSPTFAWKHVSHFSARSLKFLLKTNGFECIHLETVISEIDNIKSYMSGEYPYHGYGDPLNIFDFITPEYLHNNFLGSRLLGVFRKVVN